MPYSFRSLSSSMEKLRRVVHEIAYTQDHAKLPALHHSLRPLLSLVSSLYRVALSLRHHLYDLGVLRKHRLPVPVISIGNLTWGGNGKTPMVEYIARRLAIYEVSPLILSRGYAGGDEAKMLQRHLFGEPVKIGVGANRAQTAARFFEKYGYFNPRGKACLTETFPYDDAQNHVRSKEIGAVVLDDGMQHWSLSRDLEIVMVNGLHPWGNGKLVPLGPLREPLTALKRATIAVVHHADLVPEQNLRNIELTIRKVKEAMPIFYTRMSPKCFFDLRNIKLIVPLEALANNVVLCISAIGFADAFVQHIEKMGAYYVDRLDFSDHYVFHLTDIDVIKIRLRKLEKRYSAKPVIVLTEKDYDRDPEIFKHLHPLSVLALCSELQIINQNGSSEEDFKMLLLRGLLWKQ